MKITGKIKGNYTEPIEKYEVNTVKRWETVNFHTIDASVQLTIDCEKINFNICTAHEEGIRFDKFPLEQANNLVKAITAAVKYAQESLRYIPA